MEGGAYQPREGTYHQMSSISRIEGGTCYPEGGTH